MGKALLYIQAVRKHSLFWDWMDRINFVDKLIVKNYMHHEAHEIAMKYFFSHREYDYLIVSCDDIVAMPDHVRLLLEDEEEHGFPVVSGWQNHNLISNMASITLNPINSDDLRTKTIYTKSYQFVPIRDIILAKHGYPFLKVWFVGLPFTLIRREVLEKCPLKPFRLTKDRLCVTAEAKRSGRGQMFDLQFAVNCSRENIPIIVDQRIHLLHFKPYADRFYVGKEKTSVQFIKAEV